MKKLIFSVFIIMSLIPDKLFGQSIQNISVFQGEWYSCCRKQIEINDTVYFIKNSSICINSDCQHVKWIIKKNGRLKSGFEKGYGEIVIGYGLKDNYKWTFNNKTNTLNVKKPDSEEIYKILNVSETTLNLIRLR